MASIAPILIFSPHAAPAMAQPFLFAVGTIRLPNWPLERVELLARMVFNLGDIYSIALLCAASRNLLTDLFGVKHRRGLLLVPASIALLTVLLVPGELRGEQLSGWTLIGLLLFEIILLALLWLLFWVRGAGSKPGRAAAG